MIAESPRHEDGEQARESVRSVQFLGGMLLMAALLLYFFHLAEVPMGQSLIGVLAGLLAATGVVLLWVGRRKLRGMK